MRERDTPCCSCIFMIFSLFGFCPNYHSYLNIHKSTRHSFSWLLVPIQYRTGRLPRQSRTINTALAGVTQCCGLWGVRLCHLILLVMPRLKRETERGRDRERSQGNLWGSDEKRRKKKKLRVNVKLSVFRLGVTADKCSFGYPWWCCGSNTLM